MLRFFTRLLSPLLTLALLAALPSSVHAFGNPPVTPAAGTPARPPVTLPVDRPATAPPFTPGGQNGSHPTLPAPADVTACVDSNANLNVAWCAVPDATKYSVEVEASYDLGTACGDATEEFSFGTNGTSIEVPISAFAFDFGSGPVAACSLDVKVKGLNPPQPGGSQNNPFTEADQNPIDPTVATCPDVDTAIDPICP